MRSFLKDHLTTILVAMVTAAVTAAAPAIASSVANADKVDGFDAVGCGASTSARAGKLVATCHNGYLPNNLIRKAPNADLLDGIDSRGFYRSGSTVADSDALNGLQAGGLLRVASARSSSMQTRVGRNGPVLATSIIAPGPGFLVIQATSDVFNRQTADLVACLVAVDGGAVTASRRSFVVDRSRAREGCATNAVVPVTDPGPHRVVLKALGVDSAATTFGRAALWVLFVPFDATGRTPH